VAAQATSDVVRADADASASTIDVDVPPGRFERERDPWFYEVYARPGPGRESRAYLCESAPYSWAPGGGVERAPRVTNPDPSIERDGFARRHDRFVRRRDGNDHVLTYRWQDAAGDTRTVDYRLRRSTHEAAVDAERGYVRTFEESLSSPIAADLLSQLDATARVTGDDADSHREADATSSTDVGLASLSPARRFQSLVAFVQSIEYAYDAESTAAYDYHRTVEETLVAGIADCKDRTYLLAGLLAAGFDCETALLFQSGHVLLGVRPEDVPDISHDPDPVRIGDDEWVPIEPSLQIPVGAYLTHPFVAVYGAGEWRHHDASAIVRGADRVAGTLYDYVI
jgi:hypothetical protein